MVNDQLMTLHLDDFVHQAIFQFLQESIVGYVLFRKWSASYSCKSGDFENAPGNCKATSTIFWFPW